MPLSLSGAPPANEGTARVLIMPFTLNVLVTVLFSSRRKVTFIELREEIFLLNFSLATLEPITAENASWSAMKLPSCIVILEVS